MTTAPTLLTCLACYQPVIGTDGFICCDSHAANRRPSVPVPWQCYHYGCDPGEDATGEYLIGLDRLAYEDDWLDHLNGTTWFANTTGFPLMADTVASRDRLMDVPPLASHPDCDVCNARQDQAHNPTD